MIISIVNNKGGTGKTTSTINLGKGLALKGKKVLLIDLDPQGNLSYSLGIQPDECTLGEAMLAETIYKNHIQTREGMDIIPSNNDLINYEFDFIKESFPYDLLKTTLTSVKDQYDYILIDCPPSAGYLTVNALIASDSVLIPMQMDVLSYQGLEQIINTIFEIKENYNNSLYVAGILGVLVDARRHLTYEILERVQSDFGVNVFNNYIRQNVRAAEAPSYGISVIEYAPKSNSAKDYLSATEELLHIVE